MAISDFGKSFYTVTSCIFFCLNSYVSPAQINGKINGNLIENNQPIEFATVSLVKLPDSTKPLQIQITDSLGKFSFDNVSIGNYQIKITLLGFKNLIQPIVFTDKNSVYTLKDLILINETNTLKELVVTSQKKLIEKTTEGFIVNAAANITQMGGTATDLLKSTPTVSVDAEGVITLRGKTPLFLINGRNSKLANANNIPASSIESIEIINNASAKYDANAESGIINIRLKKNIQNGTNGAIALGTGYGSRARYNSSVIFNHKNKKWNFGLTYDTRFAGRTRFIANDRITYNNPDYYYLNQERNDERYERLQNLKLNIDFSLNAKNSFSFEAIGNAEEQDNDEDLVTQIHKKSHSFTSADDRHSWEYQRVKVAEFALEYNRKFDDAKKSLTASISTSIEKGRENTDIITQNLTENFVSTGNPLFQKTHNYEDEGLTNAKLDYGFPIASQGLMEIGYKGIFRSIRSDFETSTKVGNDYIINPAVSNLFNFNEQVNAIYALFHSSMGDTENAKWKYELGVRMELVNNKGETQDKSTRFSNNYLKAFPTANLSYHYTQDAFWKISYGKRINRPGLGQLNPFIDITNAFSPHSGNPYLKPEIIHAFELSYNKAWDKYDLTSNLFYRNATNTIRNYFEQLPNGVILNLPLNIGSANSYGVENIITGKPGKIYNFNASVSIYHQTFQGGDSLIDAVQSSFMWNGKLINNFVVSKNSKLQVIGNYNSETVTPQGRLTALYNVDLGFQQKLGKGNARLGFIVVDLFNTLQSGYYNYTSEFTNNRTSKADTRAFMLTFAYSFRSVFKEKLMENQFSKEF